MPAPLRPKPGTWAYIGGYGALIAVTAVSTHRVDVGIIGAALLLVAPAWALLVGPRRYWSRHAEMRAEQTVVVSDEHLTVKVMHDESTMEWTRWTNVQLTADAYVLRKKHRVHWILPRRAFASPADEQALRRLVTRHTSKPTLRSKRQSRSDRETEVLRLRPALA